MKNNKFNLTAALLAMILTTTAVFAHSPDAARKNNFGDAAPPVPGAEFRDIRVDHNVIEGGQKGMRIHVALTVTGMKGIDGYLGCYFTLRDRKAYLMDKDSSFDGKDGRVAALRAIKPGYDPAVYDDLDIFMPYDQLDLGAGNYKISMDVDLNDENEDTIKHLTWYDFDFPPSKAAVVNVPPSRTPPPTKPSSEASVKFERIWVDHDVTEDGKYGMRIHLKFTIFGLKGVDTYVSYRIYKEDGTKLFTNSENFRSKDGQVTAFKALKPGFEPTVYNDLQVFMPYSEFNLGSGSYDLKIDADLVYENEDVIDHLAFYEFNYSKK